MSDLSLSGQNKAEFCYSFLEYVPGGSVAGCLRKVGKFDDQVSRSFTGQILAGLEYLHMNGIIHRVSLVVLALSLRRI